jgi:quinol monooxygenase YgiN
LFGTIGRAKVKPENRQKLIDTLGDEAYLSVPGYRRAYILVPENQENEVYIVAMFENRELYFKNADDPAQNERYMEYRAFMEDDPVWIDGEWSEAPEGSA